MSYITLFSPRNWILVHFFRFRFVFLEFHFNFLPGPKKYLSAFSFPPSSPPSTSFALFPFPFSFIPSIPALVSLPPAPLHAKKRARETERNDHHLRRRGAIKSMRNGRLPFDAILAIQLHRYVPVLVSLQERGAHDQFIRSHTGLVVERVARACGTEGACYVLACTR